MVDAPEASAAAAAGAEAGESQDPKLVLAQKLFLLRLPSTSDLDKARIKDEVLEEIFRDDLATLYVAGSSEYGWEVQQEKVEAMQARIAEEVVKLDDKIKDAEENLGESEVREAMLAKALYFIRVGDKDKALEQLEATKAKTVAVGLKMDLVFHALRVAFFHLDFPLISSNLDKAKKLLEEGGDWERKNRLKVYEGLYCLASRNFARAADLFLDSIATFTTYELLPYRTLVFYTVVMSVVALDRVALKQKVIDTPEILTVIDQIPHLAPFLNNLHACNYKDFFHAFSGLTEPIREDRYLHPHLRFILREVRVVAYSQFLESYKSVTADAMARSFGVSLDFIDRELSLFIASGRLNCKIDKVAGVLETNRPDARNAQYQTVLKQGDLLLNRIQKLSRVIDV
ncbi:hypothetical protein CLOM_g22057 [Closterium sp. NIES-68]|nr:hypothetical protein CLOM_g22057 [Closterium sp. NIES-68]GJP77755.1 hypothetical protein CLOP_g8106 [Closterium sp. NIES-67]